MRELTMLFHINVVCLRILCLAQGRVIVICDTGKLGLQIVI